MIREYFSNDILTSLILFSILLLLILKKIDGEIFYDNLQLHKKKLLGKLYNNDFISFRFVSIVYLLVLLINLSILLTIFSNGEFNLKIFQNNFYHIGLFIFLKYLLEKFIGWLFKFNRICNNYLNAKLFYFNSLGALVLFLNILSIFSESFNQELVYVSLTIILLYLIISHFTIFFSFKNLIYKNWFYFILYLCTLEIIPYYYIISNIINV
tara:strand:+ start:465 stop:1097 length:633 start_codon:yes stop_codon:yes gene_type:complete